MQQLTRHAASQPAAHSLPCTVYCFDQRDRVQTITDRHSPGQHLGNMQYASTDWRACRVYKVQPTTREDMDQKDPYTHTLPLSLTHTHTHKRLEMRTTGLVIYEEGRNSVNVTQV